MEKTTHKTQKNKVPLDTERDLYRYFFKNQYHSPVPRHLRKI